MVMMMMGWEDPTLWFGLMTRGGGRLSDRGSSGDYASMEILGFLYIKGK